MMPGLRAPDTLTAVLSDWVARQQSDAPGTWSGLVEWYERDGSPNAGYRTRKDAKGTFDLFEKLAPELAEDWQHITRDDALMFQNRLTAKYRPMTVRKHLANMRKLWNACKRTWVSGNPWAELKAPKQVHDDDRWHYFAGGEVAKLLDKADLVWKARIRLALKSGLRPGEIDHLRIRDVDWKEARVRIRTHRADDLTLAWSPKDKDCRVVPLDEETLGLLQRLRAKALPGNPYLFVPERRWKQAIAKQQCGKWQPGMMLVNGKKKRWDKIVRDAEMKADDAPLVFYSLRKTCCCNMLTGGVPTHEVQALLGHSDVHTTLTWYAKVNRADAEKRIRKAQSHAG